MTDDSHERLRAIPLFATLPEEALRRISVRCSEFDFPEGHTLVQPREPGSGFYVIEEGTACVELRRGKRLDLGPGDFFGELALLVPEASRSARVRSTSRVRLLCLDRASFEELVSTEAPIALELARELARRLLRANEE